MAVTVLILIVAMMGFFPDSVFSIYLRKIMVEKFAENLSSLTLARIIFLATLGLLGLGMLYYSNGQATPVLALSGAEALPWFFSFDLLTVVDVIAAVMMLRLALQFTKTVYAARSVVAKLKAQLKLFRSSYFRVGGRRRLRVHIRKVGADGAANDDDGPLPARGMAVAA